MPQTQQHGISEFSNYEVWLGIFLPYNVAYNEFIIVY